ncbi:MAG: hypothetical protein ACI9R3_003286 [Verrucomicrobiales bacterium]|jgi:hypothetical protein
MDVSSRALSTFCKDESGKYPELLALIQLAFMNATMSATS